MTLNPYSVANALAQTIREILIPEARASHEVGQFESRDRLLDKTDAVLTEMINSMPPDPR